MRILALLCHDSVEHRIMVDDGILNVLDNLVNEPRTAVDWSRVRGINKKSRFLGTYQQSVHRLNVLKNKYGVPMLKPPVRVSTPPKVVVKKPKKVVKPKVVKAAKQLTCGTNPTTGRCKIGMKNDKKCVLKSGPNGNKCARAPLKLVKKVVKKAAKAPKAVKPVCGVNPTTGRCKIGMKNDKVCELKVAKDGAKNCTKKELY